MLRYSSTAALLLSLPAGALAQPLSPGISAGSGITAGWRTPGPLPVTPGPAKYPCGGNFGGGFCPTVPVAPNRPGYPFSGIWGFPGGGYLPTYPGYGYTGFGYGPAYNFDVGAQQSDPSPVTVLPPTGNIVLVNEFPATLTMEFPAIAEVWVNGVKGEGPATKEWTLSSPVLKIGKEYTFKVKARWTLNGKTYEYERSVDVASGNRSRAQVIAGVEVKE